MNYQLYGTDFLLLTREQKNKVNVDTPLTDSKSSDAIATAGPKFIAYCPAKNEVSPPVLAIATVFVLGTDAILK